MSLPLVKMHDPLRRLPVLQKTAAVVTAFAMLSCSAPVASAQTEGDNNGDTFETILWVAGAVAVAVIAGVVAGLEDQEDISPESVTQD